MTKSAIDYEEILECRGLGMSYEETAEQLGCSKNVVISVCLMIDAVRRGDFKKIPELRTRYHASKDSVQWVADKMGVPVEKMGPAKVPPGEKKEETIQMPSIDYSLYFQKMLELQTQTNELLNQLMDVVIPKYCADLKDNQNVNFDMICQSQKRMEDKLEAIKIGVRRKGM